MWVWLWLACDPGPAPETTAPIPAEPDAERLRAELEGGGFTIGEGRPGVLPLDGCCGWISCYKWNPSSYYALWFLPLGPGESAEGRDLTADGLQWAWRLRPDEAIVYFGPTPPPMRYSSYRTYIHETWSPALRARVPSFDSLGDTLNQVVLRTDGAAWDAQTVIISAADAGVERDIREALIRSGFPEEWINLDIMPIDGTIRFGLDDEADTVRMMHRVALFDDPADEAAWVAQPPGTVWRVTPTTPRDALSAITPPPIRLPGQGVDESALRPAVDALEDAIIAAHPELRFAAAPVNVREPDPTEDCWSGCNRDSLQSNTGNFVFPDGPDAFIVVYGVDHHQTGHASYQNAIVFGTANDDPAAVVDDRMWAGSARTYLPDHPDADQLYAWIFSRDCDGRPNCSEIRSECPGLTGDEPGGVHFRSYLDPVTGTGPPSAEVETERALVFQP